MCHADMFGLHAAEDFEIIPNISVLFGTNVDQQHQFAHALSNGISDGTFLPRVDVYVVDHMEGVSSITSADQKIYATQMHGKVTSGDEATKAFKLEDMVY